MNYICTFKIFVFVLWHWGTQNTTFLHNIFWQVLCKSKKAKESIEAKWTNLVNTSQSFMKSYWTGRGMWREKKSSRQNLSFSTYCAAFASKWKQKGIQRHRLYLSVRNLWVKRTLGEVPDKSVPEAGDTWQVSYTPGPLYLTQHRSFSRLLLCIIVTTTYLTPVHSLVSCGPLVLYIQYLSMNDSSAWFYSIITIGKELPVWETKPLKTTESLPCRL